MSGWHSYIDTFLAGGGHGPEGAHHCHFSGNLQLSGSLSYSGLYQAVLAETGPAVLVGNWFTANGFKFFIICFDHFYPLFPLAHSENSRLFELLPYLVLTSMRWGMYFPQLDWDAD